VNIPQNMDKIDLKKKNKKIYSKYSLLKFPRKELGVLH